MKINLQAHTEDNCRAATDQNVLYELYIYIFCFEDPLTCVTFSLVVGRVLIPLIIMVLSLLIDRQSTRHNPDEASQFPTDLEIPDISWSKYLDHLADPFGNWVIIIERK